MRVKVERTEDFMGLELIDEKGETIIRHEWIESVYEHEGVSWQT